MIDRDVLSFQLQHIQLVYTITNLNESLKFCEKVKKVVGINCSISRCLFI